MSDICVDQLMEYLTERRMSSLGNLAGHFDCSDEDMILAIEKLQAQKRLRTSASRCQSGCDSCSGCDVSVMPILTDKTIVISLERKDDDKWQ